MSENIIDTSWMLKLRKVLRYIQLYGPSRTWVKIRGQYHIGATATFDGPRWVNESCRDSNTLERNIALIGCGNFAFSNIAYYLSRRSKKFLRCAYDIQRNRSLSLCKEYGGAHVVADWKDIISDPLIKTVYIASNHASHSDYAVGCIEAGKNVHIEKPHVVSEKQLMELLAAMRQNPESKVFLGFNRPRSRLFRTLQEYLVRESGTLMINWFIVGHEISSAHWYYDEKEGGRVLGNLCHWTDLTLHLVSLEKAFPCTVIPATPIGSKSDFMVSVVFGDGSCAAVTFSAKGQTFEGVREVLNIQKGNVVACIDGFSSLTVDVVDKKTKVRPLLRDHGHSANILHSMECTASDSESGESIAYIAATARFFLAVKLAIDTGVTVTLSQSQAFGFVE